MAKEGRKYNIFVNAIVPIAATRMTKNLLDEEILKAVHPKFVVPLVAVLAHEKCPQTGKIFEVGGGWISELRYQRSEGVSHDLDFTPEDVLSRWNKIGDFSGKNTYPTELNESFEIMYNNYESKKNSKSSGQGSSENLPGLWKTEQIYVLMKAFVEAGLASKAVKKCNANYSI